MTAATLAAPASRDVQVIALVGLVHGVSHFFHLLLPPLFPWLMRDFGLSFTKVGATMTVFFVISGIGQALAGFLVDRFGAARVLAGGITCFALAGIAVFFANDYLDLLMVAALTGLGNSVFHPADFTVLNRQVSHDRLGHAFSAHGLTGNLGWALAPAALTGIATLAGWRWAGLGAAALALAALGGLLWCRRLLADRTPVGGNTPASASASFVAFLRAPAVWLCFAFFFLITTAFGAIQNFASPILQQLFGLDLADAAAALSAYLLGGAGGILLGGFLAQKGEHDKIIALALSVAASLALLLASGIPPTWSILPLMIGIGFCTGIAGPSRDLLVRRAATSRFGQGSYGRIYGFVYSGLDAGLALAPLLFGGLMDGRHFSEVLVGVAMLQGLAILTAARVGRSFA